MKQLVTALLTVAIMSLPWGAVAQTSIPVQMTTPPPQSNPVIVNRLFTAVRDRVYWVSCLNFTNNTPRTITAVQFKFTYLDAFETPIHTFRADRVGSFAPGTLIEGPENADIIGAGNVAQKSANCWVVAQVVGSLSKVTAEVVKVRYSDGTIYVAPAEHPIFTGTYMFPDLSGIDHPDKLRCKTGIIVIDAPWDKVAAQANQTATNNKVARTCMGAWYHEHGMTPPWETAAASPAPTPTP